MNVRLKKLEALRGFTALYVVCYHTILTGQMVDKRSLLGIFLSFGQEAVILFFVLSGFVIYYATVCNKNLTFQNFFFKRFNRIYPLFIIALFLSYCMASISAKSLMPIDPKNLFGNLAMLQTDSFLNPVTKFETYYGNLPLWSLAFEWWFYMLFYPLNKYVKASYLNNIVLCLSGLGFITYFFYPNQLSLIFMYFLIWWVGVEMARSYVSCGRVTFKNISVCLLGLILIIVMILTQALTVKEKLQIGSYPLLELRHFLMAFLLPVMGIMWSKIKFIGFNSIFGIFIKVAPISYGIYVFHYPIVIYFNLFYLSTSPILHLCITLCCIFIIAYVFEIHFQNWISKFILFNKKSKQIHISNASYQNT